jgi:hypothetical protein
LFLARRSPPTSPTTSPGDSWTAGSTSRDRTFATTAVLGIGHEEWDISDDPERLPPSLDRILDD